MRLHHELPQPGEARGLALFLQPDPVVSSFVYMAASALTHKEVPASLKGLWFAKRGSTGIWYWQRKVKGAYLFSSPSAAAALEAQRKLSLRASEIVYGFVRVTPALWEGTWRS